MAVILKELSVLQGLSKNCCNSAITLSTPRSMDVCVGGHMSADLTPRLLGVSGLASFSARIPHRAFQGTLPGAPCSMW